MAQLMLSKEVLRNFNKLPIQVQKNISEAIGKFQINPRDPSLGLHSLKGDMADPKVHGMSFPNAYRGIVVVPEKGDTYLLMYVDKHDDAYDWARNKHFQVNTTSGLFQVFDVEKVNQVIVEKKPEVKVVPDYPLAKLSDEELFQACVPKELIPAIRAISSDDSFQVLADYLPPDCREILYSIASGMTLDEALSDTLGKIEEVASVKPETTGDFTHLDKTDNFDLVLVENETQFKEILEKSLEEWRIFLHPKQQKIVRWATQGAMNINGAAGTGKTVALMHRAIYLAKNLKNPKEKILVSTFTTNLAITIEKQLKQLDSIAASSIDVIDLYSLARSICRRAGFKGNMSGADSQEEIDKLWEQVWEDKSLGEPPLTPEQMMAEFDEVIEPYGIDNEDDYLTLVRTGRKQLRRPERKIAWQFFNAFKRILKKRLILTPNGAVHEARLVLEKNKSIINYRHVLVDEIQDFNLEALKLIAKLSPNEGSDPLCTVGDGHQRVYKHKIPLSKAGINIRGRSKRLKINYRTTEQIRQWAQNVLEGQEIDDLDGAIVTTVGDMSVMKGPKPEIIKCKNEKEEASEIIKWVKKLLENQKQVNAFKTHEICITPYKESIVTALNGAGYSIVPLRAHQTDPGEDDPGIRMGDMTRIKGLEYRVVVMACAAADEPLNKIADAEITDKCLRYVAATRARERLLITLYNKSTI